MRYIGDTELEDFFRDFGYRYDVLACIDQEAAFAVNELRRGRSIMADMSRLVCYAIYGNPVDAYKFYQFRYQEKDTPTRYLPKHIVLRHKLERQVHVGPPPIPSAVDYCSRHRAVRYRMARANDQGVGMSLTIRAL